MSQSALFQLFHGLERKGPGTEAATLAALGRCSPLPPEPVVFDFGCGAGAATLTLARALDTKVIGVDVYAPFLEELETRAAAAGLTHKVETQLADFANPAMAPRSVDLLWSEGAIFILGWKEGLQLWAPLVRPGGFLALTEMTWLTDSPPEEARQAWSQWYPSMGAIESNCRAALDLGLRVVDRFVLPAAAWQAFYEPLRKRCEELLRNPETDAGLIEEIEETEKEMELYERHGTCYGYVFYILRAG